MRGGKVKGLQIITMTSSNPILKAICRILKDSIIVTAIHAVIDVINIMRLRVRLIWKMHLCGRAVCDSIDSIFLNDARAHSKRNNTKTHTHTHIHNDIEITNFLN